MAKFLLLLFMLFSLATASLAETLAAFKTNITADDQSANLVVDHAQWQQLLTTYLTVNEDGQSTFDYANVNAESRQLLERYIGALEAQNPLTLSADQELAYWINLYNALTVRLILSHYPVDSIKDIGGSFGGLIKTGPWNQQVTRINRQPLSLNQIEHEIIRPKFNDFRIHFAVNCAALGCPNLAQTAFTGQALNDQLSSATLAFINHPRGVSVEGQTLILSKIFDWYLTDFVDSEDHLPAFLATFAAPELAQALLSHSGRIRFEYDWALNETPTP